MFQEPEGYVVPKASKFLGYCQCDSMIVTNDLVSKFIYICKNCGKKARIKTLKTNRPKTEYNSQREYLNDIRVSEHHEQIGMDKGEDIKSIKTVS